MPRHSTSRLAVVLVLVACGSPQEGAERADGTASRLDTLPLEATATFTTGAESGGRIQAIGVSASGVLWFFDAVANQLFRVPVGSDSAVAVGRAGRGPGEYLSVVSMAAVGRDRMLVRDIGSSAIHVFSDDGNYVRTAVVPFSELAGQIALRVLEDGRIAVGTERAPRASSERRPRAFMLLDSLGGASNASVMADVKYSNECPLVRLTSPGTPVLSSYPSPVWTMTPTGDLLAGCAARYELELWKGDSIVRTVSHAAAKVVRTPEERSASMQQFANAMSREFAGWTWQGPEIPELVPYFFRILVAEDGRYWIKTPRPGARCNAGENCAWRARFGFDIWRSDLSFDASVNIPENFRFTADPVIRGDTVWGVSENADGLETVTRFVLQRERK